MESKRDTFSGKLGFVFAAAGSAVGLGNLWRFPYLAAKYGGGIFILVYLVLAVTLGFTLMITEIAIGRKTGLSAAGAFQKLDKRFGFVGTLGCVVPFIITPYYCVIGGWVVKYFVAYLTGDGVAAAQDGYFTGYITADIEPIVYALIFIGLTTFIVLRGVNKGIESSSKIIMPILFLLIVGIAVYVLTIEYTDASGVTRSGLQGLKIYLIPNLEGLTVKGFFTVLLDAMGQLFFSLSVAMGILIAYGSYVSDDANLVKSINQIEICDTFVAFFAGVMIIPAVFTFMGIEGMQASGPSLMFVSLPKVFAQMGSFGNVIGLLFFSMVLFAALTSSVSIMEAVVSGIMDAFHLKRRPATIGVTLYALIGGLIVCFGYNIWYFELTLPNGSVGQILDILDYISNNLLMPIVAIATCILIGWVVKPKAVIEEVEKSGVNFSRKSMYIVMIKYITPILLFVLLLKSVGILTII